MFRKKRGIGHFSTRKGGEKMKISIAYNERESENANALAQIIKWLSETRIGTVVKMRKTDEKDGYFHIYLATGKRSKRRR